MRAAPRPHSFDTLAATLPAGEARAALHRVLAVLVATAALLIVWRPAVVQAQTRPPAGVVAGQENADSSRSVIHVVKAGESLWSIAARYYGNGASWTELARTNNISVTSTRPILAGMKLKVPATQPARTTRAATAKPANLPRAAVAEAVAPKAAATAAGAPSSTLSAQTAGKGDAQAVAPRNAKSRATVASVTPPSTARATTAAPGLTPTPAGNRAAVDTTPTVMSRGARASESAQANPDGMIAPGGRIGLSVGDASAARGRDEPTLFLRRLPSLEEATAAVRSATIPQVLAPRRGEYDAAPFTMLPTRLLAGGRVGRRVGAAAVGSLEGAQRALIADEVEITAPAGRTLAVGDRLVALREESKLANGQSVVVPGGILQVTQADAGKPVVAVVKSQSGIIEQGQLLHPVEGEPAPATRASAAAGDGVRASVVWVDQQAALPTLQSFVLLDAGTGQGVRAGDEFALVRTRGSANTGEEQRIAIVRVVRSGPTGSTAIVIKQDRAEIATGVVAKRVARLP